MMIKCLDIEVDLICGSGLYVKCGSWEAWLEVCGFSKEQGHKLIQFKEETSQRSKAYRTWKLFISRLSITIDHTILPSNHRERIEGHLNS